MSWDKNTIITTDLDGVMRTLLQLKEPFELSNLGKVRGLGLNDDGEDYEIRKLEYRDVIILEQMHRTHDCDFNDILVSYCFKKGTEPKDWKLEIYVDEEE